MESSDVSVIGARDGHRPNTRSTERDMTPPATAAPPPASTSVGAPTAQRRVTGGRLSHIVTPCRNLDIKFLHNPRWGMMFTFGRFRIVSNAVVFFHRTPLPRPGRD